MVSKRAGVEWVSPDAMAGVAQPAFVPSAPVPPRPKSNWQKMGDMARSLPLPGAKPDTMNQHIAQPSWPVSTQLRKTMLNRRTNAIRSLAAALGLA